MYANLVCILDIKKGQTIHSLPLLSLAKLQIETLPYRLYPQWLMLDYCEALTLSVSYVSNLSINASSYWQLR